MKVCVIQPPYSLDFSRSDELFRWEMDALEKCDPSMDLIVLPEYSNAPALVSTKEELLISYEKYTETLLAKCAETAKRCEATLFVCCIYPTESGLRNTTIAFDRTGKEAGHYYKQHLVRSEMFGKELDKDYTWEFSEPTILDVDGVRYGFLICYDAYFYELFPNIARYNPDVIISCAHQRSDSHAALEIMTQFCAYNTNAYLIRSSVSLGEDSPNGGSSMIVTPEGKILGNLKSHPGMLCAEIDPHARYLKPAGFGNPPAPHHTYIDDGRRPWKYRPAGSAIVRHDEIMAYPRICAHRGWNSAAPENSLPAYGAAVALGAEEIEFDLWSTRDGVIVSCHDPKLDRVSTGTGHITEHTFAELRELDFGCKFSEKFTGLQIPTFEEILAKFSCHAVMNVHVKSMDSVNPLPQATVDEIVRLIYKYDCVKYCYIMSGNPAILAQFRDTAPEIARCAGAGDWHQDIVDKAIAAGAKKIQLFKPHFKHYEADYMEKTIRRAHENGIVVNMFYSDDPEEARRYLEMGCDVILTNDYLRVAKAAEGMEKYLMR